MILRYTQKTRKKVQVNIRVSSVLLEIFGVANLVQMDEQIGKV